MVDRFRHVPMEAVQGDTRQVTTARKSVARGLRRIGFNGIGLELKINKLAKVLIPSGTPPTEAAYRELFVLSERGALVARRRGDQVSASSLTHKSELYVRAASRMSSAHQLRS